MYHSKFFRDNALMRKLILLANLCTESNLLNPQTYSSNLTPPLIPEPVTSTKCQLQLNQSQNQKKTGGEASNPIHRNKITWNH